MPFIFEVKQFIGSVMLAQRLDDGFDILRGDVRVLPALDDKQLPLNVLDEVQWRAFIVAFRNLL